ncbi:hypothetical protein VTL71DRAFT_9391 [Oculimacula yallundae]|uniref:3-oxoacyl-[acyl-carrier-protein] reductase n=1 Tax=Oculimacula yallundae TaxID=86028 RepID=A0ABR4BSW9_9HELO
MTSNLITDLKPHLALVTGASGGIGRATCLALASLGCSIAVHYHTAEDKATALVKELKDKGVRAEAFKADLTNYDEVRSLHTEVVSSLGHPTILFNNAGLTLKSGIKKITEISIDEFEHTWKANCGSAFLMTQLCLPEMEKRGWGRVIFCSSVAGSSKSALHGLVHWLAGAYATSGVTINGVAPALIQETTMLPGNNEELAKKIPIGRLGFPDEVAETVLWMVKTGSTPPPLQSSKPDQAFTATSTSADISHHAFPAMQLSITLLSILLSLLSLGFTLPSNRTRFGLIGHELQNEPPAQSDLTTLNVETSTEAPNRLPTTGTLSHTVTRVHTVIETIRTTATIQACTEETSMCLHTHSANGSDIVHTRPCAPTGMPLAPSSSNNSAVADSVPMCAHTHTESGTAVFSHTIACSLIGGFQDKWQTEEPAFTPTTCKTCTTLTSTITQVESGVTSLATTTKTINPVCPTCDWSIVRETYTVRGPLNTITYTTEVWRTPQTTAPALAPGTPMTTISLVLPNISKTVYFTRPADPSSAPGSESA